MHVPYAKSVHGEEEIEAVINVLRTSTQMGEHVREFEREVADRFQKKFGIMVNSGTSANYLAVELLGLSPGSEVITPVLTFSTTVAPLVKAGLVPNFVDIAESTYNIDVTKIEEALGSKTKAIMIPNLIGNMPDWDVIQDIAKRHDLMVIEDSCDTLGALLRGTSTGIRSDICTTSFYGSHIINCAGNGGMVCLNDEDLARKALLLRSWGRSSSLFVDSEKIENRFDVELDGIPYDKKFVFEEIGYNFEPSELGAAFGLVQLERLENNIDLRIAHFEAHRKFFADYEDWFVLPNQQPGSRTGWLAFPMAIRESVPFTRQELQTVFEQHSIQTRTVFTGNILRQPGYKHIERVENSDGYPVADAVTRGGFLIGCHQGLDQTAMDYIHRTFLTFAARF